MTFFQKVHIIQICSVTQNTVFQYVKNIFLLSQKKLIFFTEFTLTIGETLSDQMEGPKIYSQKRNLSKIFSSKLFSPKMF